MHNFSLFSMLFLVPADFDFDALNPNHVPIGRLILLLSAFLFSTFALVIFYLQFGLKLQVQIKETFERPRECIDGKIYDFLITYSPHDSDIVLGVLTPTLESQHGYKCRSMELPTVVNTCKYFKHCINYLIRSVKLVKIEVFPVLFRKYFHCAVISS